MTTIDMPWGEKETMRLTLPRGWTVRETLAPRARGTIADLGAEIRRSLENPIGSPRLREFAAGKNTAAIVIDDRTRPTPVKDIIPHVLRELAAAGIEEQRCVIVIGLGTHRAMTGAEIEERVGAAAARGIKVVNHDYKDRATLVPMGKTPRLGIPCSFNRHVVDAGVVVSIGCIEAHEWAGVGGGYKNLMPGVAGSEAIYFTHGARFQNLKRISNAGLPTERCRFRQGVHECGELLGPRVFIVNAVTSGEAIMAVVAGHPVEAHEAGRRIYESMARVSLGQGPADVVIAGARPLDVDFRVAFKGCLNIAGAVKPGGVLISIAATPHGVGDIHQPDFFKKIPRWFFSAVKALPDGVMERVSGLISPSPDQAAGTVSMIRLLNHLDEFLLLSSVRSFPLFEKLGIRMYTDAAGLLQYAELVRPRAEVAVLPYAGATFMAWD